MRAVSLYLVICALLHAATHLSVAAEEAAAPTMFCYFYNSVTGKSQWEDPGGERHSEHTQGIHPASLMHHLPQTSPMLTGPAPLVAFRCALY
jgi:hypothetical protein